MSRWRLRLARLFGIAWFVNLTKTLPMIHFIGFTGNHIIGVIGVFVVCMSGDHKSTKSLRLFSLFYSDPPDLS
jgi:hypothetical protein